MEEKNVLQETDKAEEGSYEDKNARKKQNEILLEIADENINLKPNIQAIHDDLLTEVLNLVIYNMRQSTPHFDHQFQILYYGGSYFDGLKIRSSCQEYDINIVFKTSDVKIVDLGTDQAKPNFCKLELTSNSRSDAEDSICYEHRHRQYLSPEKMYQMVQSSLDRALDCLLYTSPSQRDS